MEYFQLKPDNLIDYLQTLPELNEVFSSFEQLDVQEVTDGNMNYAFTVTNNRAPEQSIFVKQAPPYIKVMGEQWPLTRQRMNAEIAALNYQSTVCAGMVPKVFCQSEAMSVLVMQNLSQHAILRDQLIKGLFLPNLAEDLASFLAHTLFYSSDFALSLSQKKDLIAHSANKDMCQITQDFVFTYPFEHNDMNDYNPMLPQIVIDSIQKNPMVRGHIAQMKFMFVTQKQALLHGDLHTGSIMVNEHQTVVIDPEFAFVGPMGFDLGALLANLYLNYFSHANKTSSDSKAYSQWLLGTIEELWKKFEQKFVALWSEHETQADRVFMGRDLTGDSHQAFRQLFLKQVFSDSIGFAACKMMRRILGVAKVQDLMQFEDLNFRAKLETQALNMASTMLVNRQSYTDISQLNQLAMQQIAVP